MKGTQGQESRPGRLVGDESRLDHRWRAYGHAESSGTSHIVRDQKLKKIILEDRRQSGTWIGTIYALDTHKNVSVDSPMSPLEAWLVISPS